MNAYPVVNATRIRPAIRNATGTLAPVPREMAIGRLPIIEASGAAAASTMNTMNCVESLWLLGGCTVFERLTMTPDSTNCRDCTDRSVARLEPCDVRRCLRRCRPLVATQCQDQHRADDG